MKHVSCLKNIPNDSYCEGWKKATCDKKNRQIKITIEGRIDLRISFLSGKIVVVYQNGVEIGKPYVETR